MGIKVRIEMSQTWEISIRCDEWKLRVQRHTGGFSTALHYNATLEEVPFCQYRSSSELDVVPGPSMAVKCEANGTTHGRQRKYKYK